MGIERIGGGAVSTASSAAKPVRQQNTEIQVSEVTPAKAQAKIENVTVNAANKHPQQDPDAQGKGVVAGEEVSKEKIKSAVDDLNKQVKKSSMKHTSLSFKYHEDTNRISITVTDSDTDEVIREIPPEKALDMLAKAWELAGLMVDERR